MNDDTQDQITSTIGKWIGVTLVGVLALAVGIVAAGGLVWLGRRVWAWAL